jgi:hypothetical protein
VVRQVVWRVLEPAGALKRRDVHEDRATRRTARILGGVVWLVSAVLLALGAEGLGWGLALAIGLLVALDASLNFCALCFIFSLLDRRGMLPAAVPHGVSTPCVGER